jgi:hypothetical protein
MRGEHDTLSIDEAKLTGTGKATFLQRSAIMLPSSGVK